jgi:hypothetical protein
MSMGDYDETEHERRARKAAAVETTDEGDTRHHGTVEFDAGDSAEDLLDQFQRIKAER